MESLAFAVFIIWSAVFLSGPLAILADYLERPLLSALLATASIWLGIFWFSHTYTAARYMGLLSAGMGVYVVWRNARRL